MTSLTRDECFEAIRAWTYAIGCGPSASDTVPAALGWARRCWEMGDDHVPFVLAHDLGQLLLLGREVTFTSGRGPAAGREAERRWRLAYEDRLLSRWLLDPTVRDAHVILAGLPAGRRGDAVAHAIGLALGRRLRGLAGLGRVNPAHVRTPSATFRAFLGALPAAATQWAEAPPEDWRAWVIAQLERCAEALGAERLFSEADRWELAHLAQLPRESDRMSLREVHALAARIGGLPAGTARRLRRRARAVAVAAEHADRFPAGGFDGISTAGTPENLVRSEVAYVGERLWDAAGLDMFDVRFAEAELLYYTRDQSPLLDARRRVVFVIDRPAELRRKHARLPAQIGVLVQAVCLQLEADMVRSFGTAGVAFHVSWRAPSRDDRAVADLDRALMALSLAAEVAHGRVRLGVADGWEALPDGWRVVCSLRPAEREARAGRWVRLADERWRCGDGEWDAADPVALRALVDHLLAEIAERG